MPGWETILDQQTSLGLFSSDRLASFNKVLDTSAEKEVRPV